MATILDQDGKPLNVAPVVKATTWPTTSGATMPEDRQGRSRMAGEGPLRMVACDGTIAARPRSLDARPSLDEPAPGIAVEPPGGAQEPR